MAYYYLLDTSEFSGNCIKTLELSFNNYKHSLKQGTSKVCTQL